MQSQAPLWPAETNAWTGDPSSESDSDNRRDEEDSEDEGFSDIDAPVATPEGGFVAPRCAQSDSEYDTQDEDDDEEDDEHDAFFSFSDDAGDDEDEDEDASESESSSDNQERSESVQPARGTGTGRRGGQRGGGSRTRAAPGRGRGRERGSGTRTGTRTGGPSKKSKDAADHKPKQKGGASRIRRSANVPVRSLLAVLAAMGPDGMHPTRPGGQGKHALSLPDKAEAPSRDAMGSLVRKLIGPDADVEGTVSMLGKRSREGNRVIGLPDPGDSALVWITEALETGADLLVLCERTREDPCGWTMPVFGLGVAQELALCSAHDAPRTTVKSRRACRRCGKHNVQVRTLQLRRCDEPAVDDCVCLDCNAHWRG